MDAGLMGIGLAGGAKQQLSQIIDPVVGDVGKFWKATAAGEAGFEAATGGVKASGAELDTGTDDAKFATAKALKDSHNVPSVSPGTSGNVLTSNGTDWTSATSSTVDDTAYDATSWNDNLDAPSKNAVRDKFESLVIPNGADYLPLAGDTMEGVLVAQANTSYTTAQMRNVILSTGDASGGGNGDVWIKYSA